ncbi:peptidase C14 caspase catalytic subunit p20 [Streptomyces sp. ISL-12]|uniref:peptidase C14 caspase catalytic subunit p20 n=1 Tax=Streptomyces sp. ISL-12 TaxID=2819177 RepID=UPI001BE8DF3E|nr:peptidase C14 caspase catalytic subunit p20 [Streptomyces sp. ISL-12]MBT2412430.1 peptidase C14 caspase catalytic subunit p20 [Streptomyces sp. ISL-12]
MVRSDTDSRLALLKAERRSSSLVGTIAVPEYLHPDEEERQRLRRPQLAEVRDRFTETVRERLGFGETLRADRGGAARRQLWAGLEEFVAVGAQRKILYWTGHGVQRAGEGYFLACADSWQSGEFDPARAVPLLELVGFLLRPEYETDTLLIIDACSSQSYNSLGEAVRHAVELERDSAVIRARQSRRKGFAVIGTSGADAQVPAGRWVTWLEEALAKPDFVADDQARPFEPSALYLPLPYLCRAVDARAADDGLDEPAQRPDCREVRALPNNFLDNPYYHQSDRPVYTPAVLTRRKPWIEAEQFGLEENSHLSRHFTGRRDALSRIVRWMDTHPKGLLAVTGLAGTGKTALLGWLALTSLPSWRETLGADLDPATLPRAGTVHAALSCRGQSAHSLAAHLREVLADIDGAPPLPEEPVTSETFTAAFGELVGRAGSVNLLFDALDEALPDQAYAIARHVLGPLADTPGVRVIVGTRTQPRRRTTAPAEEESLLDALELSVEPVVLGDDEEARASITGMVRSVLDTEHSPYRGDAWREDRDWTAETVAARSHGSFLVARLTATGLARRTTVAAEAELLAWLRDGGTGLRTRLAEETRHLSEQPGARRAHEVLRALAVIQGPGMSPDAAWLTLANALRDAGSPELTAEDLRQVCRSADGGIVAPRKDGARQTAGRIRHQLAHPSYGEFFLSDAGLTAREAHRRVLDALRARAGGDWSGADEYTLEYLGAHAAQVGPDALRELFEDVGFLLRTNPDVMLPLAAGLARDCDGAALYGRVAGSFPRASGPLPASVLLERKALLSATAFVSHRDATYRTLGTAEGFLPWQEYWTDVPPDPPEWRRAAPSGGARALSWRAGTGAVGLTRADTLTAGGLGEVQVLHPESGARLLTRRLPRTGGERGRPLSEVREVGAGARWATVARDDQAVYFWRAGARMPDQEYRWGGSVRALSVAEAEGESVALAADGDRVWVWVWQSGTRLDTQLKEVRTADVRHLAALTLGTRMFVLAAGAERVELFEVGRTRTGGGGLRACRTDPGVTLAAPAMAAAAFAVSPREGFLAVADGTAVHVWRCEAVSGAEPVMERTAAYPSNARGLAFGRCGDELLLAGYEEVAVRIWSVGRSGREATLVLDAPREGAVAFEPGGQGLLAVADGPYIRVVDVLPALEAGYGIQRRPSNERPVLALAGAPDGPPLLCRAWHDRIRISRPEQGDPASLAATELAHDGRTVTAVAAVRAADGWTVAAAAGRTVRLWRLDEDLSAVTHRDLPLGGDAGQPARALSLVGDPAAGILRLSVADGRRLVRHEVPADVFGAGTAVREIRTDRGFCGIDTRVLRDGSYWMAGDLSDQLRVWTEGEHGVEQRVLLTAGPSCLALGELYDDEDDASMPLLAWADHGSVYVKDCSGDEGIHPPERLPGDFPDVTSLMFAGPVERPVLLLCAPQAVSRAWDVWSRQWLAGPGIPTRGYDVHAVRAAMDPEGLVMALQGEDRCDLIRLPHTFFGAGTRGV